MSMSWIMIQNRNVANYMSGFNSFANEMAHQHLIK